MVSQSEVLNGKADYLVACDINIVNLCQIIFEDAPLDAHPLLHLQPRGLLHHSEHVRHLLDGHHLLAPRSHPQVADAVNGSLHVGLFERLHIDVTFDMLRCHNRPGNIVKSWTLLRASSDLICSGSSSNW